MKIIAFVFLILFIPAFATEDEWGEKYRQRVQTAQQEQDKLRQDIYSVLHAKQDILTAILEQIRGKRARLSNVHKSFSEELDTLLSQLKHPEELLSDEQQQALIGFPYLKNFEPIDHLIDKLGQFIKIHLTTPHFLHSTHSQLK